MWMPARILSISLSGKCCKKAAAENVNTENKTPVVLNQDFIHRLPQNACSICFKTVVMFFYVLLID
jgi:hypothetical protein